MHVAVKMKKMNVQGGHVLFCCWNTKTDLTLSLLVRVLFCFVYPSVKMRETRLSISILPFIIVFTNGGQVSIRKIGILVT